MGLGLAAALSVASPAEAAGNAVRKGTMRLAAERLAGIGARVDDPNTAFYMSLLTTTGTQGGWTVQYPRAAFDYFIIDGLSIGGSVGFGVNTLPDLVSLAFLPRVGYAFELSKNFEFWPRGGVGVLFVDEPMNGDNASALLTLEGMFLYEMVPHALLEFGPIFDISFANGWPMELGATAGIAIEF